MRRVNPEQIVAMLGIVGVIGLFLLAFYQLTFTQDEIKADYCVARGYPRVRVVEDTTYCAGVRGVVTLSELRYGGTPTPWGEVEPYIAEYFRTY